METAIRNKSLVLTLLIHGLIILLMFLFVISTPNPPFAGGGGGVLVSIGTEEASSGDVQATSEVVSDKPQQTETQVKPQVLPDELLATQEDEKTTDVEVKEPKKKEEKKPETKPKATIPVTPVKVEVKKTEPKLDQSAVYHGSNKKGSDGNAKTGNGDQGDPNGSPDSKFYGKNGNGNGTGTGNGNDIGPGTGPGSGSGNGGKGPILNLAGRKWLHVPKINDNSQEIGKVVVEIIVNKAGKVISAIPGGVGSTTTSAHLYKLAKEAALATPFNTSPDGKETQKGTITFNFVLE